MRNVISSRTWLTSLRRSGAVILISSLALLHSAAVEKPTTIIAQARRALVAIRCQHVDGTMTEGSGFIITPKGIVATAYHIVADAKSISIKTSAGDVFDVADVVGVDPRRDLVLLRFPGSEAPSLPLADPAGIEPGAPILVLSNPLGLEGSVTSGVVSALRDSGQGYQTLQFTAPVSKGSSGAPVLNERGEVIGLVTSKIQGEEGLNFAIPVQYLRGLLDDPKVLPLGSLATTDLSGTGLFDPDSPGAVSSVKEVRRLVLDSVGTQEQGDSRNVGTILMMAMESHLTQAGFEVVSSPQRADARIAVTWTYYSLTNKQAQFRGHINLTLAAVLKRMGDGRVLWGASTEAEDSPRRACDRAARTLADQLATARSGAP